MVKAVIIFLGAMALVGMIGNAVAPGRFWRGVGRSVGLKRCKHCGRPLIGKSECDCRKQA